jgi:hypothetical protein
MEINSFHGSLSCQDKIYAHKRLTQLFLELGTRKDNPFLGSGLGGNNFQLLVLLGLSHTVTTESVGIDVSENGVTWGIEYLQKTGLIQLRHDLDLIFEEEIKEQYKYLALSISTLVGSEDRMLESFQQNRNQFPKVDQVLSQGRYGAIEKLTHQEELILGYLLCIKLAKELDQGDTKNVSSVGNVLNQLSSETILMSVRQFIQIGRLVKFDLDEHPIWENMLNKVNKEVFVE